MNSRSWLSLSLYSTISFFLPSSSLGCPYCFIDQESPQIKAGTAAIVVMIAVVSFVLSMIGGLAWTWAKRAKELELAINAKSSRSKV